MQKLKPILVILLAVFVIGLLVKSNKLNNQYKTESTYKAEYKVPMKDVLKESFMKSCNVSDGLYDYCDCSFEHMINALGVQGFIDMGNEYAKDTTMLTPEMDNAFRYCSDKYIY